MEVLEKFHSRKLQLLALDLKNIGFAFGFQLFQKNFQFSAFNFFLQKIGSFWLSAFNFSKHLHVYFKKLNVVGVSNIKISVFSLFFIDSNKKLKKIQKKLKLLLSAFGFSKHLHVRLSDSNNST